MADKTGCKKQHVQQRGKSMKKLLQDRQSGRLGVFVAPLFGLGDGVLFWFFLSSFRQFHDEDVTPDQR